MEGRVWERGGKRRGEREGCGREGVVDIHVQTTKGWHFALTLVIYFIFISFA